MNPRWRTALRVVAERALFWILLILLSGAAGFIGGGLRGSLISTEDTEYVNTVRTLIRKDTVRGTDREQIAAADILPGVRTRMGAVYRWQKERGRTVTAHQLPKESQFLGFALIVTSDGWFVTSAAIDPRHTPLSIATVDAGMLKVTRVVADETAGYTFLKTSAVNLSPIQFPSFTDPLVSEDAYLVRNATTIERLIVSPPRIPSLIGLYAQVQPSSRIQKVLNADDPYDAHCMPVVRDERFVFGCTAERGIRSFRYLQRSLSDLLRNGAIGRPTISIPSIDLSASVAPLVTGTRAGAVVTLGQKKSLRLHGPDNKPATLHDGDIILSVNDEQIDQNRSLAELLNQYSVGESLTLRVFANGNETDISFILN